METFNGACSDLKGVFHRTLEPVFYNLCKISFFFNGLCFEILYQFPDFYPQMDPLEESSNLKTHYMVYTILDLKVLLIVAHQDIKRCLREYSLRGDS